jgi:hypothetical protein
MALQPQATLEEMIEEVLDGLGEGGEGVASAATRKQIETQLRRAQRLVRQDANWTINRIRTTQTLQAGQTEVEWPDDTEPGEISEITASKVTNPRDEWTLEPGITADDRSAWLAGNYGTETYCPYKYDFQNGMIVIGPSCSSDVTLNIAYYLSDSALRSPGSRPNCDATALVMKAEILVRNIRGGDFRTGITVLKEEFDRYIAAIKPKQGAAKKVIQPGSAWAENDPARRDSGSTQRHWMYRNRRP